MEKKKNSFGTTLIWLGILATPAMLIGSNIGASAAGGRANIPSEQIVSYLIVSALMVGLGLLLNYLKKRKENKENQKQQ